MSGFFLAFLPVFLVTLAGRDAVRVARLAGAGVSAGGLMLAAAIAGVIFAGLAAMIADQLAPWLNFRGRMLIAAIALAMAACEVVFLRAPKAPREPTLSVGAAALVLAGALITGAAGLLVIALTLIFRDPFVAAAGGAIGALAALAMPALAGKEWERRFFLATMRWVIGGLLLLACLVIVLPMFVPFS